MVKWARLAFVGLSEATRLCPGQPSGLSNVRQVACKLVTILLASIESRGFGAALRLPPSSVIKLRLGLTNEAVL